MRLLWFVSTLEDTLFLKEFRKHCDLVVDVFNLNFITRIDLGMYPGVQLMPRYSSSYSKITIEDDLSKVFNVLSGRLSLAEAKQAYRATMGRLSSYSNSISSQDVVFIIPSGRHVHHVAATRFANSKKWKKIYINYSNFPGYTFFDPEGTDCLASIFKDPEKLDRLYGRKETTVNDTFSKFAELKRRQKTIPQKSSTGLRAKVKEAAFFLDSVMQHCTDVVGDRRFRLDFKKEKDVALQMEYSNVDNSSPYLFFPLQVSTDQQVLVNYDGGSIFKAIDEAYEYARSLGLCLYVREHPAEGNKKAVRSYLREMAAKSGFKVTDASVPDLISGCVKVITINSTVGLESRINLKPVHFLGRSFYAKATDHQLACYLDNYLVAVDYHQPSLNHVLVGEILELGFHA